MPTPAAVTAPHNVGLITSFDIDKPERLNKLYRKRSDQGLSYFNHLMSMGFTLPVAQGTYGHNEDDWIHETFNSLAAIPAPGPGNNLVLTLDTTNLNGNNQFYPRLWDTVMTRTEVTGQIIDIDTTTATAPVLTIRPNDQLDDFGAIALGEEVIIISDAWSEGSQQPASITRGVNYYSNDTQIIKEKFTVTGSEMTNQKWFDEYHNKKKGISAYHIKGQEDTEYTMTLKMDGAMLFQKRTDNNIVDNNNPNLTAPQVKTTEGAVPYIRKNGNILTHTPGQWTVAKFNQMIRTFTREFAGSNICGLLGIGLSLEIDDVLKDYFNDSNIQYAKEQTTNSIFKGDTALAASVDFKCLKKGGKTFLFNAMECFDHPKLYGANGFKMPDMGIFMPISKKKDKLTGNDMPTFGMRYKSHDGYSRKMEVWDNSGAGKVVRKVIPDDVHNLNFRCEIGSHFMGGNQMVLVDPS